MDLSSKAGQKLREERDEKVSRKSEFIRNVRTVTYWEALPSARLTEPASSQTSRNYLHLSISESDLQLLGTATGESLRL